MMTGQSISGSPPSPATVNGKWEDELTIFDSDGVTVSEGPMTLSDDGCHSIPYDYNPCMARDRTDD